MGKGGGRKMSQGLVHSLGVRDHGGQDCVMVENLNLKVKEGKAVTPAFMASHPQYENHIQAFCLPRHSVCF